VIVLGNLDRPEGEAAGTGMRLGRQDLQLLSPLASGLAVTLGNATQVAQIKEEKSTLEQILGLSSDGILLLDGKGRVRVWNQAMERITGVPSEEAVGLPYNEWLAGLDHDGKPVRLEDLLAAASPASPRASSEVQIRTSEGLERWLRCNHSLLYEGGEWTTDVVIVHDVTRIRPAERAKTDFVATVSHEPRTPITPIKGYVEILQARGPNLSEDKRQDMLRIVAERPTIWPGWSRTSCWRRGSPRSRAARPWSACSASAPTWPRRPAGRPPTGCAAPTAGWSWSCRPGRWRSTPTPCGWSRCWPTSSPTPTSTPRPTRRCGCGCGATTAGPWRPGPGHPREELDRVFEKFHRVEDPMTTGGTGLGLYIARELTRAMGGEIEATSAPAGARPSPSACRCS
jgi:PAS domain S-box-containing protein